MHKIERRFIVAAENKIRFCQNLQPFFKENINAMTVDNAVS